MDGYKTLDKQDLFERSRVFVFFIRCIYSKKELNGFQFFRFIFTINITMSMVNIVASVIDVFINVYV